MSVGRTLKGGDSRDNIVKVRKRSRLDQRLNTQNKFF